MKINNKLSRKRAMKLAARQAREQGFVQLKDGTEVLRAKESRRKPRRWSFLADIKLAIPGETVQSISPVKTLKLEAVAYGTAAEARIDAKRQEMFLRASNETLKNSQINVRAVPHETVSKHTLDQLSGYRDMAMILDRALELSIREAENVVGGKSVGSDFISRDAAEATDTEPAKAVYGIREIKELFYQRALDLFKAEADTKEQAQAGALVSKGSLSGTSAAYNQSSTDTEHREFEPEIIEIQRATQPTEVAVT